MLWELTFCTSKRQKELKEKLADELKKKDFEYEINCCGLVPKHLGGFGLRYYPNEPLGYDGVKILCKMLPSSSVTNIRLRDKSIDLKGYNKILDSLKYTHIESLWMFHPKDKMEYIPFEYLIFQTPLKKLSFSLTMGPSIKAFATKIDAFKNAHHNIIGIEYDLEMKRMMSDHSSSTKDNKNILCVIKVRKLLDGLNGEELNGKDGPIDESRLLIEFDRTESYTESYDLAKKISHSKHVEINVTTIIPRAHALKFFLTKMGHKTLVKQMDTAIQIWEQMNLTQDIYDPNIAGNIDDHNNFTS
jgi:hypothetical protein